MAKLIKCKDCGHEVSKSADACPNCGRKTKAKTSGCAWIILIGLIGFIWLGASYDGSTPTRTVTAAEISGSIAQSDDFDKHRDAFIKAATSLVNQRRCSVAELRDMGGFVKSQNYKDQPVYFTYCDGNTAANRIMLDVSTGRIFK